MSRYLLLFTILPLWLTLVWALDFNWSYQIDTTKNSACIQALKTSNTRKPSSLAARMPRMAISMPR